MMARVAIDVASERRVRVGGVLRAGEIGRKWRSGFSASGSTNWGSRQERRTGPCATAHSTGRGFTGSVKPLATGWRAPARSSGRHDLPRRSSRLASRLASRPRTEETIGVGLEPTTFARVPIDTRTHSRPPSPPAIFHNTRRSLVAFQWLANMRTANGRTPGHLVANAARSVRRLMPRCLRGGGQHLARRWRIIGHSCALRRPHRLKRPGRCRSAMCHAGSDTKLDGQVP